MIVIILWVWLQYSRSINDCWKPTSWSVLETGLSQLCGYWWLLQPHGIIWVPLTTGALLWLSVITSSRPSPIGPWLYFLGLKSFGNGILSWLFWGHSQATFRYYFKLQRFPTIRLYSIIAGPVRDVSRTQMNAGDSSEFYIHCVFSIQTFLS